jgi:hypothetical protein
MSTSVQIVEKRIEALKSIPVTDGNRAVISLMVDYLNNIQREFNSGDNLEVNQEIEDERLALEKSLKNLVLLPLPW